MIEKIKKNLPQGFRWFDMITTEGHSSSISFKNNRLHSINEKQGNGFGIRVNSGNQTGFSFTNDLDNLEAAVKRAVSFIPYGDSEDFDLPAPCDIAFEPYDSNIENYSTEREIEKAGEIISDIRDVYSDANIGISIGKSNGLTGLVNSSGFEGRYRNSFYSISVSVTLVQDNGSKIDVWDSQSSLSPASPGGMTQNLITMINQAQTPSKAASAVLPVIFTPNAFAHLLGIVISGLDAKSIYKEISPYSGKLGETMFGSAFSVTDDPTALESPYSYPFDDEGVTGRKKDLIEKGRVASYISDLKYSSMLNIRPTGNASRGYASLPGPSFSNIIIEAGGRAFSEIMKSLNRGILVHQFIGLGQSNTLTGDFSANLDLAYLFENGEITGRVKDCMIAGNIFELLKNDFELSCERKRTGASLVPYAAFPAVSYTA